jgi:small subunit ribosomal protein S5
MNKENNEQPENIEDPKKQETPEADAKAEETSSQEQQEDQKKPQEQESNVEKPQPVEKPQSVEKPQPVENSQPVEKPQPAEKPQSVEKSQPVEKPQPKASAPEVRRAGAPNFKKKTAATETGVPEIMEKVISINRITKVTKGGKKLSFSALVVVGDARGNVGYSLSKAAEVAIAIRKAMATAKKNMVKIPMKGTTIPHEIIGRCSGSRVLLKPASDGTGVIASGPVRAVCDGAGIHNILTKCHRSNNPINVVKATIDGLTRLKTVQQPSNEEEVRA